jgi:hypothetical protein
VVRGQEGAWNSIPFKYEATFLQCAWDDCIRLCLSTCESTQRPPGATNNAIILNLGLRRSNPTCFHWQPFFSCIIINGCLSEHRLLNRNFEISNGLFEYTECSACYRQQKNKSTHETLITVFSRKNTSIDLAFIQNSSVQDDLQHLQYDLQATFRSFTFVL